MAAEPRDLHIPLTVEHREQAIELASLLESYAISAREAFRRGSDPLGLHHVSQMRHTLLGLIPLAKRLSDTALREPNAQA
mgnify:CR=1 FL=1